MAAGKMLIEDGFNRGSLAGAKFQQQPLGFIGASGNLANQATDGVESVAAAIEGKLRFEKIAFCLGGGDVGQVGTDNVKVAISRCFKKIALDELDVDALTEGIPAGQFKGGLGNIQGYYFGLRKVFGQSDSNGTGAAAAVRDDRR